MSESKQHILLVEQMNQFVCQNIIGDNSSLLYIDSPESSYKPRSIINGFIPDLYYNFNGKLIIGEAKTDFDVEREHSINQYYSYFAEANNYDGDAILVFIVSWKMYGTIKNIIKLIKRKDNYEKVKIIVINNKGDVSYI